MVSVPYPNNYSRKSRQSAVERETICLAQRSIVSKRSLLSNRIGNRKRGSQLVYLLTIMLIGLLFGCSSRSQSSESEIARIRYQEMQRKSSDSRQRLITNDTGSRAESAGWSFRQPGELAPGNEIRLYEASDSALNGVFQVNEKGKLILPYEVEVLVEGLQVQEVKSLLNRRFRQFLRKPNFQVSVEGQEVYVHLQGLVEKPGSYLISSDSSLDEILLSAGGLLKSTDKRATARYVRITQFGKPRLVNLQDYYSGTPDLIPSWQGGESLFFQYEGDNNVSADREYIHVLGEVLSPGAYPFSSQLDILAYLTEAGGPTDRADLSRMTLLSREEGGLRQAQFNFDEVRTLPGIQPGDTLIIHSSNPTGLERSTGIAASLAAVLSSIGLIAIGL